MRRTTNPTLKPDTFDFDQDLSIKHLEHAATINGIVERSLALLAIIFTTGYVSWLFAPKVFAHFSAYVWHAVGASVSLCMILSWVITIRKSYSAIFVPLYAAIKGVMLSLVLYVIPESYRLYVAQALISTASVFFMMLFFYRTRVIRLSQKIKLGLASAVFSIGIAYAAIYTLSFFNLHIPYLHEDPLWLVGVSLLVTSLAALSFVQDFELIHQNIRSYSPKYMEWYCSFSLIVILLWVYLGFLKLFGKEKN